MGTTRTLLQQSTDSTYWEVKEDPRFRVLYTFLGEFKLVFVHPDGRVEILYSSPSTSLLLNKLEVFLDKFEVFEKGESK